MGENDSWFIGIETLLDLHNWTGEVGDGFWTSIRAFMVTPHKGQPHGLNYSLTLHTPGDSRLVGYDNAHELKVGSGPAKRSKRHMLCWDHRHWRDAVYVYEFISAGQLLEDFWADVEKMLKEEGVS